MFLRDGLCLIVPRTPTFVQALIFISSLVSDGFLCYKKGLKVMFVIAPQQQSCYRSQVHPLFVARDLQVSPVAFLQSPQGEVGAPPETSLEILVRSSSLKGSEVLRFWEHSRQEESGQNNHSCFEAKLFCTLALLASQIPTESDSQASLREMSSNITRRLVFSRLLQSTPS